VTSPLSSFASRLTPFPAALVAAGVAYLMLGAAGIERPLPGTASASTGDGDVVIVTARRAERPFIADEAVALAPGAQGRAPKEPASSRITPPRSSVAEWGGQAPRGAAAAPAQPGAPQSRPAGADPSPGNVSPPVPSAPAGPPSSPPDAHVAPPTAPPGAPPVPAPPPQDDVPALPPTLQLPLPSTLPPAPALPRLPQLPQLPLPQVPQLP
jgi:hypothetical protein